MSLAKVSVITTGLASLFSLAEGLDSPCYGYGSIFGEPSSYLLDDYDIAKQNEVGQGDVYMSHVDYLFEGSNLLKTGYKKKSNDNYRESGWTHGSSGVT